MRGLRQLIYCSYLEERCMIGFLLQIDVCSNRGLFTIRNQVHRRVNDDIVPTWKDLKGLRLLPRLLSEAEILCLLYLTPRKTEADRITCRGLRPCDSDKIDWIGRNKCSEIQGLAKRDLIYRFPFERLAILD